MTRGPSPRSASRFEFVRRPRASGMLFAMTTVLGSSSLWSTAAGATVPAVSVAITPCDAAQITVTRLEELISTEVSASGIVLTEATTSDALRGSIVLCDGSPERVKITFDDGRLGAQEREVDLADVEGELRARTVAVTFAEMLTARLAFDARQVASSATTRGESIPIRDPPRPAPPPRSQRGPAPGIARPRLDSPSARPPTLRRRYSVSAGLHAREFARPKTVLLGPWLSVGAGRWRFEALYLRASAGVPLGRVGLRSAVLSASWTPWEFGQTLRVELGLRGELGMTWATGSPLDGDRAVGSTLHGEQAAATAESRLEIPWTSAVALQARFAAGVARGPTAIASGVAAATCGGWFAATGLGLRLRL